MSKKIYIIDDDELFADALRRKFVVRGYSDITIFHSGKSFFKNNLLKADLVFLDYNLGDCTGIEILHKITNNTHKTNVIMLSSVDKQNIISEALSSGAKRYIIKGEKTMNNQIDAVIFDLGLRATS